MLLRLMAVTAASVGLICGTAVAADNNANTTTPGTQQNTGASQTQQNAAASQQNTGTLPQEISQKLKDEGFTDVKVVPGSFLVSAKDKAGDPVSMITGRTR